MEAVQAARRAGFTRIKINSVLLRGFNGPHLADLVRFAAEMDCEIRFIELMPCGEGAGLYSENFLSADEALEMLKGSFSYLGQADDSATARRHRLVVAGRSQVVGFITPVSDPFCGRCDRVRLDCYGRLAPCLREETRIDLLDALRAGQPDTVRETIREALANKCAPRGTWPGCHMVAIGG